MIERAGNAVLLCLLLGLLLVVPAPANRSIAADAPAVAKGAVVKGAVLKVAAAPAAVPAADKEHVEADISTRNVAVGANFSGSQVVIFGTVENSKQPTAEAGYYDIAVVIEGPGEALIARRKSNVFGVWLNTRSMNFLKVPSYYAVLSTRPLGDMAPRPVLFQHGIGFGNMRLVPVEPGKAKDVDDFRDAVIRLKMDQQLYQEEPTGVAFIGRSLFRATLTLPANVSVGEFSAWVYLFREGELLSTFKARLNLERDSLEQTVFTFAHGYPFLYGIAAVAIAVLAGIAASAVFRRS